MTTERAPKKLHYVKGQTGAYCWITKPDVGTANFIKKPTYIVNLTMPEKEGRKWFEMVEEAHNRNFEAALKDPKLNGKGKKVSEAAMPCYFDEELNKYVFSFKMNASYKDKKSGEDRDLVLRCVDSTGERMPKIPNIGTGSTVKVAFAFQPFAAAGGIGAGIRLQLNGLMLIDLVEFSAGNQTGKDSAWGDEVEDGGYQKEAADHFRDEEEETEDEVDSGDDF